MAWDEERQSGRRSYADIRLYCRAAPRVPRSPRPSGLGVSSLVWMKVRVTLSNGQEHDVIGIADAKSWMNSFVGRGSSQLGDWLEVVPEEGDGRTFIRASDVVAVHLIDDLPDDD
jgi:hypothetical protein